MQTYNKMLLHHLLKTITMPMPMPMFNMSYTLRSAMTMQIVEVHIIVGFIVLIRVAVDFL